MSQICENNILLTYIMSGLYVCRASVSIIFRFAMSFAVVHFIEDDVFSHVPINWLNASQTECLWPPNNPKNVTHLIKTRTAPGKNWCTYKVVVEGIYGRYETIDSYN